MKTINRWFVISVILLAWAIIITAKFKSKLRLPESIRSEAATGINHISDNVPQSALPHPDSIDSVRELARFRYKIGTEGALAKLTVKVVDSSGRQVSGATVSINFIFFNNNGPENIVTGLTDNNGLFAAVKKTTWQSRIWVEKEGYYTSSADYLWNRGINFDSVKNGRWQPWNPTIEVVLKEKRDLLKGVVGRTDVKIPKDTVVGFDCIKGDCSLQLDRELMLIFILNTVLTITAPLDI